MGGNWKAKVVLPVSDEELLMFHGAGIFNVGVKTGKCTKLSSGTWNKAKAVVRCKADPSTVMCLHGHGIYRIKIADGKYEKLSGKLAGLTGSWSGLQAAVY